MTDIRLARPALADFVCILIDEDDKKDDKKGDDKKHHDYDDKKDHGKDYDYDDDFVVKIKDFEFLCVEVDFKDWKTFDVSLARLRYASPKSPR